MAESFLRRFVSKLAAPAQNQPSVFLAAFGKHPAWDDHMPDHLGLETRSLIELKQLLYGGIRGNIESGAWDKAKVNFPLIPFDHAFVWRTPASLIAGRLWQSRDGKGRDAYPMIVAAECVGANRLDVAEDCIAVARELQAQLGSAGSPADVQSVIDAARVRLRERVASVSSAPENDEIDAREVLNQVPELGPTSEGMLRILYHIDREMNAYRDRKQSSASRIVMIRPQAIRVPRGTGSSAQSAALWIRFLLSQLSASISCAALVPENNGWVDVVVGQPTSAQLFCVRVPLEVLPLTNKIPYTLDADFAQRVGLSEVT
jgi:hypothetical protein